MEEKIMLRKLGGGKNRGRTNMRIDSIKLAIGMSLQELSRVVEDRTLWTRLIHRVTRSQSRLNSR